MDSNTLAFPIMCHLWRPASVTLETVGIGHFMVSWAKMESRKKIPISIQWPEHFLIRWKCHKNPIPSFSEKDCVCCLRWGRGRRRPWRSGWKVNEISAKSWPDFPIIDWTWNIPSKQFAIFLFLSSVVVYSGNRFVECFSTLRCATTNCCSWSHEWWK